MLHALPPHSSRVNSAQLVRDRSARRVSCRAVDPSRPRSDWSVRCTAASKTRFDAIQQTIGHHLGHRVTQEEALAHMMEAVRREGAAFFRRVAREHYRNAGHGAPETLSDSAVASEGERPP